MPQLGTQTDGSPYTRRLTTRTRRLNLYQQGLVSVDLTVLSKAPNLEILELGHNPLRSLDLAPLARCERLEELTITAEAPIDLAPLAACARLRALHVYARRWPALDLAPLAGLPHFESLYVHGGAFPALDLAPLARCPAFRRLSLHCPALQALSLAPLAACAAMASLNLEHIPVQSLALPPWPNLLHLNLLAVPLSALDLLPLCDSPLERLRIVKHALDELDLTPLVGIETLDDVYVTPRPRLMLDDVYLAHPRRILSPGVRDCARAGLCLATGRRTRLRVLLRRWAQQPPTVAETYVGMDEAAFWRLIEDARASGGDLAIELARRLWSLAPEDLQRFHDQFWRLMGLPSRAVHQTVYEVRGGCSDDDFMDFRQWLITQGRDAFYAVVEDPAVLSVWGEGGIGFDEGIVSTPLYQVRDAVRTPRA